MRSFPCAPAAPGEAAPRPLSPGISALTRVCTLLLVATLGATGCAHQFRRAEIREPVRPLQTQGMVVVDAPLRAHLADGTIVVFADGARMSRDSMFGGGVAYSLGFRDTVAVRSLAMNDVLGVESHRVRTNIPLSLVTSVGATALIPIGAFAVACAADPKCFGSCPTVYTGEAADSVLEAELFSYSIAPLLEGRDVDVLSARAPDGVLRLDVRNEALETHFVNHLEVLEVAHAPDELVVPDQHDAPLVLAQPRPPARATDGAGRDLLPVLSRRDQAAYRASEDRIRSAADGGMLMDHIDLAWPVEASTRSDSAVVVLRLRNSLLTSVLFYDLMLGSAGPHALEWMGAELQQIGSAVELGSWWSRRMGLRVLVPDGAGFREVARVAESGPIAWSAVAVPLPPDAVQRDSVRVRLLFVADGWRIDQAMLSPQGRRVTPQRIAPTRFQAGDAAENAAGMRAIRAADDLYLETTAATRFRVEFDVGPEPAGGARTLLLSSQGYYNEWMRPVWLTRRPDAGFRPFSPDDDTLREAMGLWLEARADIEQRFHDTRIPVR